METEAYEPRPDPALHPDFSVKSPGDILIRAALDNTEFYFRIATIVECSTEFRKRLEGDLGDKVYFILSNVNGDTTVLLLYLLKYISTGINPPDALMESDTTVILAAASASTESIPVIFRLLLHFLKPHRVFLRFAVAAIGRLRRETEDLAQESLGLNLLDIHEDVKSGISAKASESWQSLKMLHLRHALSIERFRGRLDDIKFEDEGECKECGKEREEVDAELRDRWYRLKTVADVLEVWEKTKGGCEGCEEVLEQYYGGAVKELEKDTSYAFGLDPLA